MTTIIRGARVLTLDAADSEHAKADIVIDGATITAVGSAVPTQCAEIIDAHGLIAMPGLINGHYHSQVSLMAGSVPSLPLELFMLYEVPPLGDRLPDPRLIYLQTMLGAVEMLRNGVTAVHDDAFHNPRPHSRRSMRSCPPIATAACARPSRSITRIGPNSKSCPSWQSYCRPTSARNSSYQHRATA